MPDVTPPVSVIYYQGVILLVGFVVLIHSLSTQAFRLKDGGRTPTWRISPADFGIFVISLFFAVLIVQISVASFAIKDFEPGDETSPAGVVVFGSLFHLTCIGVFLGFRKAFPKSFRNPLNSVRISWFAAGGFAFYAFLAILPVLSIGTLVWMEILEAVGITPQPQDVVETFFAIDSHAMMLGMLVVVVILAPVSEEIIFRGCLYRFLKERMPMWIAIAASAVLFSLMHRNSMGFVALGLLGALLCVVYERTGSLKVPILLHAIFNLNTVILILMHNGSE